MLEKERAVTPNDIVDDNSDTTEEEEVATNESLCDLLLQRRLMYFEDHRVCRFTGVTVGDAEEMFSRPRPAP
jgi:hypothetical protein